MQDTSKFKLGLFVCIAIVIFMSSIAILGFFEQFKEKAQITTVFSESVAGLTVGSAVKYQGVPIGKVTDIFILNGRDQICVKMEINLEQFRVYDPKTKTTNSPSEAAFYKTIERGLEVGARCTLQLEGIAGGKYVQIDAREDRKPVEIPFDIDELGLEKDKFIPAESSTLNTLLSSISSIAEYLKSLDYENISVKFTELLEEGKTMLDSGNKLIGESSEVLKSDKVTQTLENIRNISEKVNHVANNVDDVMTKDKLDDLAEDITDTTKSIRELAAAMKTQADAVNLNELSDDVRITLVNFQQTAKVLEDTMINLSHGIGALTELCEHIESDPHFLLRDKKPSDANDK